MIYKLFNLKNILYWNNYKPSPVSPPSQGPTPGPTNAPTPNPTNSPTLSPTPVPSVCYFSFIFIQNII